MQAEGLPIRQRARGICWLVLQTMGGMVVHVNPLVVPLQEPERCWPVGQFKLPHVWQVPGLAPSRCCLATQTTFDMELHVWCQNARIPIYRIPICWCPRPLTHPWVHAWVLTPCADKKQTLNALGGSISARPDQVFCSVTLSCKCPCLCVHGRGDEKSGVDHASQNAPAVAFAFAVSKRTRGCVCFCFWLLLLLLLFAVETHPVAFAFATYVRGVRFHSVCVRPPSGHPFGPVPPMLPCLWPAGTGAPPTLWVARATSGGDMRTWHMPLTWAC